MLPCCALPLCIAAVRQCCRQQEWLRYEQSRTLLLAALDFIDSHNRAVASVLDRPTTWASSYPYRTLALLLRKPCLVSAVSTSACHSNVSSARPVVQGSAETETLRVPVYQVRWIALECSGGALCGSIYGAVVFQRCCALRGLSLFSCAAVAARTHDRLPAGFGRRAHGDDPPSCAGTHAAAVSARS
jgi:hypothetical protein